jgi:hypothetical protein
MEKTRDKERNSDTNSYDMLWIVLYGVAMDWNLRYYNVVSTLHARVLNNVKEQVLI